MPSQMRKKPRGPILHNHRLQVSRQGSQSHGFAKNDHRLWKINCWVSLPSRESIMSEVFVLTPREIHLADPYYATIIPSRPKVSMFYKGP